MRFLSLFLLALAAGCAPQVTAVVGEAERSAWGLQSVVRGFAPDRGAGAQYKVRERVFFSFTLSQPGYVTLVTRDPDTTVAVLERNVRLAAGRHTLPRAADTNAQGQATYLVFPPAGVSSFRLMFTDQPVSAPQSFNGKLSAEEYNRQTQAYVGNARTKDVVETTMETVQ